MSRKIWRCSVASMNASTAQYHHSVISPHLHCGWNWRHASQGNQRSDAIVDAAISPGGEDSAGCDSEHWIVGSREKWEAWVLCCKGGGGASVNVIEKKSWKRALESGDVRWRHLVNFTIEAGYKEVCWHGCLCLTCKHQSTNLFLLYETFKISLQLVLFGWWSMDELLKFIGCLTNFKGAATILRDTYVDSG